jgi:exodeoxyribonuclease-5
MFNKIQMFNTNEEITVYAIERSEFHYGFEGHAHVEPWTCSFQSWKIHLKEPDGREAVVHLPIHEQEIVEIEEQLVREAHLNAARWEEKAEFGNNVARLQCVYALTVHTSQGSTFQNVFVDIGDIRKRERNNPLEMQQLLYVAMTRPTTALMLINTNSYS